MSANWKNVLDYWFGPILEGTTAEKRNRLWFGGEQSTDDYIRTHFETQVLQAARGQLDSWKTSAHPCLALIILLDQFPLNMYRKSARAFETEAKAIEVCLHGLEQQHHHSLAFVEKVFFYLPLEHSENLEHQNRCVALFSDLYDNATPQLTEHARSSLDYAIKHRDIIEQFGRFPHRNEFLGRTSTAEELEFLEDTSNRFGQ